jgi:hypothetical protein
VVHAGGNVVVCLFFKLDEQFPGYGLARIVSADEYVEEPGEDWHDVT